MIKNAKDTFLNNDSNTLPNMQGAMDGWMQKVTLSKITKTTTDFEVSEVSESIVFFGVVQPLSARSLEMKPEGQRQWRWKQVHSKTELSISNDDIIYYDSVKYRVKSVGDYHHYGYYRYELMEDYTNAS